MKRQALLSIVFLALAAMPGAAQKFYPDDPLIEEPPTIPVKKAANRKLSDYYDIVFNTLATPGEKQRPGKLIPAQGVNTLGDPMDGAWWERRHYWRQLSREELKRGPGNSRPPSMKGSWTVVSAKTEGITPGFVIIDSEKRRYYVKFDPPSNPEMATGADQISLHIFYALGYHVPENYVVYFNPEILEIGEDVSLEDRLGHKHKMTRRDLSEILMRVRREPDGRYRATASLSAAGKSIGPYRYNGTRSDDPNDTVPHENRRDLRGMDLACAWVDHDDSRAINTLDMLMEGPHGQYIQHYQLDFGSTLGSGSDKPNSPRSGGEYLFGWRQSLSQVVTLGFAVPYWAHAHFPNIPAVGRFESAVFDPERWTPEYPNPAFLNRLPDDEFWMAKQIVDFTDDDLRAIVETAQYSDPRAAEWILKCLIERRDKIGRAVFPKVLPFDRFELRGGSLVWEDIAATHHLGGPLRSELQWSVFDNQKQISDPVAGADTVRLPPMDHDGYWLALIQSPDRPGRSVRVYVRSQNGAAEIVGVERTW